MKLCTVNHKIPFKGSVSQHFDLGLSSKKGTFCKFLKLEAKSWDTPSGPWQVVQCDFIGPLKKASNGARYIMTFIDLLTDWPEAFSTKDSTAKTAAEVFLYQIVCWYGRVERLHTNCGATFLSDLFREITSWVACKQTFTTGGMPTGNARVERMHKTLETITGCYVTNGHENWPDLVPIALWTIRSTTSVRTGFSPFTLTCGRDPVSMGLPEVGNAPESLNDHEWFMQTRDNLALFRHIARDVVAKYEKGMRDKLDEHARPTQFLEGDLVYMYDVTAAENMASKFSNVYRGPHRVVEVKDDHLVRIISLATGKEVLHFVNIQKIKRAYGPWSPALTNKPSQETEVTPDGPLISSKETNLNVERETSENNIPTTHAHAQDAGQAWATQDDIGQRVPSKYNLRNAGTPASYARFFDEMDDEEW